MSITLIARSLDAGREGGRGDVIVNVGAPTFDPKLQSLWAIDIYLILRGPLQPSNSIDFFFYILL